MIYSGTCEEQILLKFEQQTKYIKEYLDKVAASNSDKLLNSDAETILTEMYNDVFTSKGGYRLCKYVMV